MRLTRKDEFGVYVWSDYALEIAGNDPTIIGQTIRNCIGVCEDCDLTLARVAELALEMRQKSA